MQLRSNAERNTEHMREPIMNQNRLSGLKMGPSAVSNSFTLPASVGPVKLVGNSARGREGREGALDVAIS